MPDAPPPVSRRLSGGCQCGAVRYALSREPVDRHICHCRMCQKASGSPFMVVGRVPTDSIEWTRGAPKMFRSSNIAERGFCEACGTPLTYQWSATGLCITLVSLDDPTAVSPVRQCGIESRLPWVVDLAALPGEVSGQPPTPFVNHQHPDHEA